MEYLSLLCCYLCCSFQEGGELDFHFPIDVHTETFLTFLCAPCQSSSIWALAFLTPSLHSLAASQYSSQVTCPSFHCLCILFLLSSLTSRSQFRHACLLPSFPDFLHQEMENSCALKKASLKACQICSTPLSLRTDSQEVLWTKLLKSWHLAFLKLSFLILLSI